MNRASQALTLLPRPLLHQPDFLGREAVELVDASGDLAIRRGDLTLQGGAAVLSG